MPEIALQLNALTVLSTANSPPYWDEVGVGVRWDLGGQTMGTASGQFGLHGSGSIISLSGLQGQTGTWPIVIDTDEHAAATTFSVDIFVQNHRGLDKKLAEQLILATLLGVAGAGAGLALDALKPLVSAAALAFIKGGTGAAGGFVGKLLEKLVADRPDCVGEMGRLRISMSIHDLLVKPYTWVTISQNFTQGDQEGWWPDAKVGDSVNVGRECGTALVKLDYGFKRREIVTTKSVPLPTRSYEPQRAAALSAWNGMWSEGPSGLPRLRVFIEKGSAPGADTLKVTIAEDLLSYGGEAVLDGVWDNRVVESASHLIYAEDVWARRGLFAGILGDEVLVTAAPVLAAAQQALPPKKATASPLADDKMSRKATASMAALIDGEEKEATALPVLTKNKAGASIRELAISTVIPARLTPSFIKESLTIQIPEIQVSLALYKLVLRKSTGELVAENYCVRYYRAGNLRYTTTDAMLMIPQIIR